MKNLAALRAAGAFISPDPVKRSINWRGQEFDVFIIRPAFADIEAAVATKGEYSSTLIATCVRLGEKADEAFTVAEAKRLDPDLAAELMKAVASVNQLEPVEKNSPTPTSSGASSSLPASVDAPSPKPSGG